MLNLEQKCLNHLSPYFEIRVHTAYVNLDHDAAALSLILNGLSSISIVDNYSYLKSNELIYYAVISYMSASKRFSGMHVI